MRRGLGCRPPGARAGGRRPRLEAALGLLAVLAAIDLGTGRAEARRAVLRQPVARSPDATTPFHVVHRLRPDGGYQPGLWDIATLPGVLENVGTMECDTDLGLHSTHRDRDGRMPGVGAYGEDDPDYRGEAYVAEGGRDGGEVTSFTPNEVTIHVEDARPGDHVVLNQNWDPGWSANGVPAAS